MKHIRLELQPSDGTIHPLFSLMTNSDFVTYAQMLDWNIGDTDEPTMLFAIEGDHDFFQARLDTLPNIADDTIIAITPSQFYLQVSPAPTPLTTELLQMYGDQDLIILHPLVYKNGSAYVNLLGDPSDLQTAVRGFSTDLTVAVKQVSDFIPRAETVIYRLSPRQKEAVEIAQKLGYYEHPRQATHREIAEQMGCAPNTASVHLQKAEAKIISGVLSI